MSLQSNQTDLDNLDEAVELQRGELQKVSSDLNASKNNVHNLQQSKLEKEAKQQEYAVKLTSTRLKLERETEKAQSLEERHQQVHTYHKEHENALKAVEKELEQTKESMFKFSQELFKQRKDEASLVADISGTQSTARNLQAKIHDLDQRSLKQQEMLYNIEFQVQQLERKVSRASGKRSQEETLILNKRIAELQAQIFVQKSFFCCFSFVLILSSFCYCRPS
jgi:chromosome segregation ATPase